MASAYVGHYPGLAGSTAYNEAGLFVDAEYKGERGHYCLAMPVDDDMVMAGGRERWGHPKKLADYVGVERHGDHVVGRAVRKGTEILRSDRRPGTDRVELVAAHCRPGGTSEPTDGRLAGQVVHGRG